MAAGKVTLRRATPGDAVAITRVLRRALSSLGPMPELPAEDDDLAFVRATVLAHRSVTVAEAGAGVAGFMATRGAWIDLLYVDPAWSGQGIGGRLLAEAGMAAAKLYCFRSNARACRFYERHGFRAQAFSSGSGRSRRLPDVLYVRYLTDSSCRTTCWAPALPTLDLPRSDRIVPCRVIGHRGRSILLGEPQ